MFAGFEDRRGVRTGLRHDSTTSFAGGRRFPRPLPAETESSSMIDEPQLFAYLAELPHTPEGESEHHSVVGTLPVDVRRRYLRYLFRSGIEETGVAALQAAEEGDPDADAMRQFALRAYAAIDEIEWGSVGSSIFDLSDLLQRGWQ